LNISTRTTSYPVEPTNLSKNYHQVAWVNVAKGQEQQGYTKAVYNLIAQKTDLVSDHKQYGLAKDLWKSLAKSPNIGVYVFEKDDYIRDSDGNVVKYNGLNIDDETIWGNHDKQFTLLVASVNPK
jgi:hypothetical protein